MQRMAKTLRNRIQSFPFERYFKTVTAAFQDKATHEATLIDISSDK